jgi:hypothetical protein
LPLRLAHPQTRAHEKVGVREGSSAASDTCPDRRAHDLLRFDAGLGLVTIDDPRLQPIAGVLWVLDHLIACS